jgi:hypothetical protein
MARAATPRTAWVLRVALVATLAGALVACQAVPPSPRPAAPAPNTAAPVLRAAQAGDTLLHLDSLASRIELHLAAAGPLAGLGHPHVIVVHALAGEVLLPPDLERTSVELRFAVEAMSVDDAADRAAAGGEFAAPIPDTARAGTREHMLGPGQLDAAHFDAIVLRAQGLRVLRGDAAAGEGELDLIVQLLGRSVPVTAPVRWQHTLQGLRAEGEFPLLQSALGIQPYSLGGGALRVADAMQARYSIRAH